MHTLPMKDWREQIEVITGTLYGSTHHRLREVDGGTLFYGTRSALSVGAVVGAYGPAQEIAEGGVRLTSLVDVARSWAEADRGTGEAVVYVVEPVGPVARCQTAANPEGRGFVINECWAEKAIVASPPMAVRSLQR
jgi:hypothetical protein